MKFLLLKDLDAQGKVTKTWINYHQDLWSKNPKALREEYVLLVKSIAKLHTIEQTLRVQIFGIGASAADPPQIIEEVAKRAGLPSNKLQWKPDNFDIGVHLMRKLSPLIDLFLEKASTTLLKKL